MLIRTGFATVLLGPENYEFFLDTFVNQLCLCDFFVRTKAMASITIIIQNTAIIMIYSRLCVLFSSDGEAVFCGCSKLAGVCSGSEGGSNGGLSEGIEGSLLPCELLCAVEEPMLELPEYSE